MRVLLDTNILISYLLAPTHNSVVARVTDAGLQGQYTLVLPEDSLSELMAAVHRRPYLAERIASDQLCELVDVLRSAAEVIPHIKGQIPPVTRDRGDDYWLAYALVGKADYLVTGDRDLLVLGQAAETRIVSPAAFAALLAGTNTSNN